MTERWRIEPMHESADDSVRLQPEYIEVADTGAAASVNALLHSLGRTPRGIRIVNKTYTPPTVGAGGKRAGDIFISGESSAPANSVACDGASLLRADYAALFARIGTAFGAADASHFNVPDLRGRSPIGKGTGTGGGASGSGSAPTGGSALTARSLADWLGAETHTLSSGEMPSHTHTVNDPGHTHDASVYNSGTLQTGIGGIGVSGSTLVSPVVNSKTTGITNNNTGGGSAHNNVQPVLTLAFYIQTTDEAGSSTGVMLDWYRLATDSDWTDRRIYVRFNVANARVLLEVF